MALAGGGEMEQFHCPLCGRSYPVDSTRWRCDCGSPLDLRFSPRFPEKKIVHRGATLWRYREALPILEDRSILSFGEGFTPLEEMEFHGQRVWVKIDYLFPTGSYKDRGATVLLSKVNELGVRRVVEDSSGNAGSSIAAYSAKAGIECHIYTPRTTSEGKLSQIRMYGARLHRIEGSREETARMAMAVAKRIYYASHCWNPYFLHGTKTFAFEVWEQMGWRSPDTLVLPVGHGTLLLGAYIGFKELKEAGRVKGLPKLVGIQAEACSPLYQAYVRGLEGIPEIVKGETLAEGIAIAEPVRARQILEVLRETGGEILTVTETEILRAWKEMGRRGHFIEPTSAATIAGLKRYLRKRGKNERIVSSLTGTGLKAVDTLRKFRL
ncbi:MAG: threonine synthase [Desulfobacterota bacterium]|nr:threonine synthase [Thermodesulfobacteriota bacterium]